MNDGETNVNMPAGTEAVVLVGNKAIEKATEVLKTKKPTRKTRSTPRKKVSSKKDAADESRSTAAEDDTKPSTATAGSVTDEDEEDEIDYQPYDEEAWAWMLDKESIPGGLYSPILYVGEEISKGIAKILGRPMVLLEAQCLVKADGPQVKCAATGTIFQPVKYLPFLPKSLENSLREEGKLLTEVNLPFGGAYYVDKRHQLMAFSGCIFQYSKFKERYEYRYSSPLVQIARKMSSKHKFSWGIPRDEAEHAAQVRITAAKSQEKVHSLADHLIPNHKLRGIVRRLEE